MKKYSTLAGVFLIIGILGAFVVAKQLPSQVSAQIDKNVKIVLAVSKENVQTKIVSGFVRGKEEVAISPKIFGRIQEIRVAEGDKVSQGDVIAVLDGSEYGAALNTASVSLKMSESVAKESNRYFDEQVAVAEKSLEKAKEAYDQAKSDSDENARDIAKKDVEIAEQSLDAAKRFRDMNKESSSGQSDVFESQRQEAGIWAQETIVRAPFSGVITRIPFDRGTLVSSQTMIASMTRSDAFEVSVFVEAQYQSVIQKGQAVSIRDVSGSSWNGTVESVSPGADRETQKTRVVVSMQKGDTVPQLGGWVEVAFKWHGNESGIFVPVDAVVKEYYDTFVWVKDGDTFEKKKVTLGAIRDQDIEVLSGLAGGEQVVTEGKSDLSE